MIGYVINPTMIHDKTAAERIANSNNTTPFFTFPTYISPTPGIRKESNKANPALFSCNVTAASTFLVSVEEAVTTSFIAVPKKIWVKCCERIPVSSRDSFELFHSEGSSSVFFFLLKSFKIPMYPLFMSSGFMITTSANIPSAP